MLDPGGTERRAAEGIGDAGQDRRRDASGLTDLKATPTPKLSSGQVCSTIKAIASGSSRSCKVTGRVDTGARGARLTKRVSASGAGMEAGHRTGHTPPPGREVGAGQRRHGLTPPVM